MASPTILIKHLSHTLGMSQPACESTWKDLRANNLVVNSGRGKRGTQVSVRDCAVFLLALCGADHVKDSVRAAQDYGDCIFECGGEFQDELHTGLKALDALGAGHTLLDAVEALIEAFKADALPTAEVAMAMPDGRSTTQRPVVSLILTLPAQKVSHPAHIDLDQRVVAEYYRRRPVEEMFDGVGGKQRLAAVGDLRIDKRVTSTTFKALGQLLRNDV